MSLVSIFASVGKFISKLFGWAKSAIAIGRDVATEIKSIVDNPEWDVAVSLTSTKLDDIALAILREFLAKLVIDLNLTENKVIHVDGSHISDTLKEASESISKMIIPEAKAGTLNTISAAVATKVAELKGEKLPIETALTTAQPVYFHPELLDEK